jgi:ribosome maturation factor RimP
LKAAGPSKGSGGEPPVAAEPFPGGLKGLASSARAPVSELFCSMGFELCAVEVAGAGGAGVLRFTADRLTGPPDGTPWRGSGITLDDCAALSRAVSALLDDLWPGEGPGYVLEVSSPGLDRAVASEDEAVRFSGSLAKLRIRRDGRTSVVSGRLNCSPGALSIVPVAPAAKPGKPRPEMAAVAFEWAEVAKARLLPEI